MSEKYVANLTDEERNEPYGLTKKGETGARKPGRAHMPLLADKGGTDKEMAGSPDVGIRTAGRLGRRFAGGNLGKAPDENPRPGGKKLPDGRQEASLIAEASAEPPEGRLGRTMRLLADRVVGLGPAESVSAGTIRLISEKMIRSPGRKGDGAFRQRVRSMSAAWRIFPLPVRNPMIRHIPASAPTRDRIR